MKIENNQFILETKPRGVGCVYVGISILGATMVSGAVLYLNAVSGNLSWMDLPAPGFAILLGSILFMAGFSHKKMDFNATVIIDKEKQNVTFFKTEKRKYSFGMGLLSFIRIVGVMRSRTSGSGSSRRTEHYPTYQIFLVKKDGSHFWLDTFLDKEATEEFILSLHGFCGIAVRDECGFSLDRSTTSQYSNEFSEGISGHSEFIEIKDTQKGQQISLKKNRSLFTNSLAFLFYILFFSAPIMVLFIMRDPDWYFWIFFGVFSLLWYGILFLIVSVSMKKYIVYLNYDHLTIEIGYKISLLNRFMGAIIVIPRDKMEYIRVHRLEGGGFWLTISANESLSIPEPNFFQRSEYLNVEPMDAMFANEKIYGLWEITGYARSGMEADYADLLYLEDMLQRQFFLKEKPLES